MAVDDEFEFDRVVNLNSDLGVGAGDDVTDVIESLADGTLLEVPAADYTFTSVSVTGRQTVGIRGTGGTPVFRQTVDAGKRSFGLKGDEILLENLTFSRVSGLGAVDLDMVGTWVARDITKAGHHAAGGSAFRVASRGGGRGVLERCAAPEVQGYNTGSRGANGIFVNRDHAGDIVVRDCRIERAGDNGLYGSPPGGVGDGSVRVVRGLYRNNNISGVRLGSPGSGMTGTVIVNDQRAPSHGGDGQIVNQRGAWIRRAASDMFVDNCDVSQLGGECAAGVLVAESAGCNLVDSRVRNDAGPAAIRRDGDATVTGSGNHVTGTDPTVVGVPSGVIACAGDGCDDPRTTARSPSDGNGDDSDDGDDGDGGGGQQDGGLLPLAALAALAAWRRVS